MGFRWINNLRPFPLGAALTLLLVASPAMAGSYWDTTPVSEPVHTDAELYQIFTSGTGRFDPGTMQGKIFPYRLTQNGTPGGPLYNGCYDEKNIRLHDLDADNTCATTIAARPGMQVFRLFIGYKVSCDDLDTTTGNCRDTSLQINCQLSQVQTGSGFFAYPVANRDCATGSPIVRRAKANPSPAIGGAGCYAGQDGTTYPTCTACADGWYNDTVGVNKQACKQCPVPTPTGVGTAPFLMVTNPSSGAISASQCKIASTDPWTCGTGFDKSPDGQSCIPSINCTLSLGVVPTNPTKPDINDGKIIATYSGAQGSVINFNITAPTTIAPTSTNGTSASFDNLGHNTYTISATDSVCSTTASVSLTAPTSVSCATCPTGSTANGNLCVIANQTSCPTGFTLNSGNCVLACTNGTALPDCKLSMNTSVSNPTSPVDSDGVIYASWTGQSGSVLLQTANGMGTTVNYGKSGYISRLPSGTYTIIATDTAIPGCEVRTTRTLVSADITSTWVIKCSANVCFRGIRYGYTCLQNTSTLAYSAQDYYTNLKDTCSPETPDITPEVVCADTTLCPVSATAPSPRPTTYCSSVTCSSGVPLFFKSVTGLEEFAKSHTFTNPSPSNSCQTYSGYKFYAVCSNGGPLGQKCPLTDPLDYYLAVGTTETCY